MDAGAWLLPLLPVDAVWFDVPRRRKARLQLDAQLAQLPTGTGVVLTDTSLGSRRRDRRVARRGGIDVEREFLAIPGPTAPAFVVEDRVGAIADFWRRFVTVPAGVTRLTFVCAVAIRAVAVVHAWRLVGGVVPGRMTAGRRG